MRVCSGRCQYANICSCSSDPYVSGGFVKRFLAPIQRCLMKAPVCSSAIAWRSCSCVFITIGPYHATGLGDFECWFAWPAHGFKPAADIHLGVSFATEMPGSRAGSGSQIPLDDRELLISALDHKPMDRILTDDPANLALEFLQTRHALSVERWLGKNWLGKN